MLLVAPPGTTAIRLAAERVLRERAWRLASSPAAADLLAHCGPLPSPAPEWLTTLHSQLPASGDLVALPTPESVATGLDAAPVRPEPREPRTDARAGHGTHSGHDAHAGHRMEGMAERGDDRDGLRLDRWHLAWGPGLADWPGGLVLRVRAQGDVVQEARADLADGASGSGSAGDGVGPYWSGPWTRAARGERVERAEAERHRCAAHLDSLGRLLAVAGWADQAARARRLRDAVLAARPGGPPLDPAVPVRIRALTRRVRRSRTLRWLTRGLGPLPSARARALGIMGPALLAATRGEGDVHARVRVWLEETDATLGALDDHEPLTPGPFTGPRGTLGQPAPSAALLAAVPETLAGTEFACARLVLASLDPDPDELTGAGAPLAAGVRGPSDG